MFIEPRAFAREAVARFLSEDHKQLAFLFEVATLAFDEGRLADGEKAFQQFRSQLNQHLRMEEEILFPKLEHLVEASPGVEILGKLREEHKTIRWLMNQIVDMLSVGDNPSSAANQLAVLLEEHARAEEPSIDQLTDRLAATPLASVLVQSVMSL